MERRWLRIRQSYSSCSVFGGDLGGEFGIVSVTFSRRFLRGRWASVQRILYVRRSDGGGGVGMSGSVSAFFFFLLDLTSFELAVFLSGEACGTSGDFFFLFSLGVGVGVGIGVGVGEGKGLGGGAGDGVDWGV